MVQPAIIEAQLSPTTLMLYLNLLDSFPSGERIFDLFKDAAFFASVFKARLCYSSLSTICQDSKFSWAYIYPLTHDLLSYREPVDLDDYESVVKESCRLALSVFNTRIRRVFGIAPLVLDIYVDQLLSLLQNPNIPKGWGVFNELKLWVLVIGVIEARGETRTGLVALLMELIHRLGVKTHLDLETRMRELIWVHEIDGDRFWALESELCELWIVQRSESCEDRTPLFGSQNRTHSYSSHGRKGHERGPVHEIPQQKHHQSSPSCDQLGYN
jgi:hypothetical protein